MAFSSIPKPATPTYGSISTISSMQSPTWDRAIYSWDSVLETWDDYKLSIYLDQSKPATPTYTTITKPT